MQFLRVTPRPDQFNPNPTEMAINVKYIKFLQQIDDGKATRIKMVEKVRYSGQGKPDTVTTHYDVNEPLGHLITRIES